MRRVLTAILIGELAAGLTAPAWSADDSAQKPGAEQRNAQSTQPKNEDESQRHQYVEDAKDGRGAGTDWSGRKDEATDKSQSKLERH
jgi:hypothetical protein